MERIDCYETLARLASQQLRPGVKTNVIISEPEFAPAIETGALMAAVTPAGLLLCRDRGGHYRFQFCLNDLSVPLGVELPTPIVTEVAFRPQDVRLRGVVDYLKAQGFVPLMERVRMSRKGAVETPTLPPLFRPSIEYGPQVLTFLQDAFSAITGCLPDLRELNADLEQQHVILLKDGSAISGCLRFSFDGRVGEIRHLAVREDLRGQGLTRHLIAGYLHAVGGARSIVWVRSDYSAAKAAYTRMGFDTDGRRSIVLWREREISLPFDKTKKEGILS